MDASLELVRQRVLQAGGPEGGYRVQERANLPVTSGEPSHGR
jgi:hypothetical protein